MEWVSCFSGMGSCFFGMVGDLPLHVGKVGPGNLSRDGRGVLQADVEAARVWFRAMAATYLSANSSRGKICLSKSSSLFRYKKIVWYDDGSICFFF